MNCVYCGREVKSGYTVLPTNKVLCGECALDFELILMDAVEEGYEECYGKHKEWIDKSGLAKIIKYMSASRRRTRGLGRE
jgi:NMD protein affecting ribosome stability and mRNA decay